jgi:hypothetical protein
MGAQTKLGRAGRCRRATGDRERRADPGDRHRRDLERLARSRLRRGADLPDYLAPYLPDRRRPWAARPRGRPAAGRSRRYGTGNRALRPVARGVLRPGVVLRAWVPFADGAGYKCRPVVVIAVTAREVDVFPVTSRLRRFHDGRRGYVLTTPEAAGLRDASAVVWRPTRLARADLLGTVGELTGLDRRVFEARCARTRLTAPAYAAAG